MVPLAVVAALLGVFYATVELGQADWDPAGVIAFGEAEPERVVYAFDQFDRQIPLAPELGHDGRFFFIQAMDPLYLNPAEHGHLLDRPRYRAQRMLYPSLAALGRPFGADGVAVAMLLVNVIAYTVGSVATALLAQSFGATRWLGLVFALNPGVRWELDIDGAGVVALALVMVGLYLLRIDRWRLAVASLVLAVLAREVMLLSVLGIGVANGVGSIRQRSTLISLPIAVAGAWWLYVRQRLAGFSSGPSVEELGTPFAGFLTAFQRWLEDPGIDLLLGVTYAALAVLLLVRAIRVRSTIEMAGVGFCAVAVLLTEQVWLRHFNISRALSPVLTLYFLSVAFDLTERLSSRVPIKGGLAQ